MDEPGHRMGWEKYGNPNVKHISMCRGTKNMTKTIEGWFSSGGLNVDRVVIDKLQFHRPNDTEVHPLVGKV